MADAAPGRRRVAAFDFDGTMVPGDSLVPFVWRHVGRRRFLQAALRHGARVLLATVAHVGSRDAAKAAFVGAALRGLAMEELRAEGDRFSHDLERRANPEALDRLRWHRDAGHELVMISASLLVYLEPLARRWGFDGVLATGLEVGADGRLTGRLDGGNVRGPEKVVRLQRWLAGSDVELWAYGDSPGDRELLAAADHGFLIEGGRFGDPRP